MMASGVLIRRSADRDSRGRRPLRLEIRRRRARCASEDSDRFVTQVMLGQSDAVLLPRGAAPVRGERVAVVEAVA